MAKRDPEKTARNKEISELKEKMRALLPTVISETGYKSEATLNATIGSKSDLFIDLKHEVISSPEEFVGLWIDGLKADGESSHGFENAVEELWSSVRRSKALKEYLLLFLRRSYLKHYEELSKARPPTDQSELWIGRNHANYGLLVTPRFVNGQWENDKSEIRHFKHRYWSIGHILETGLVIPGKNRIQKFGSVEEYLNFFEDVLVRPNASPYGNATAVRYSKYVRGAASPNDVPLLIPELRYAGLDGQHKYRLDFCTIDVETNTHVGFELSPWSTHGEITGTRDKTQKKINEEAAANFAKEVKKQKDYFRKHGIAVLVYTDDDLSDLDELFKDIASYLKPRQAPRQLSLRNYRELFK